MMNCYALINQVNILRNMVSTHQHTVISSDVLDYDQPNFFIEPETYFDGAAFQYGQMNRDDSSEDGENVIYHYDTDFDDSDREIDYDSDGEFMGRGVEFTTTTITFTVTQEQGPQTDNALVKNKNLEIDINSIPYDPTQIRMTQCSICITDFKKGDMVCKLDCKHAFHDECIRQWGKYKPECALCRTQIPIKQ